MAEIMEKKEFDEKLILEVEANPCLYNKGDRSYSNRNKKEEGWQNIALILNTDVKICKERWKNLRDTFAKNFKKEKDVPSGSQAFPKKKPWPYFEIMKFLVPNIEVPRTLGNMASQNENSFVDLCEIDENEELPSFPSIKRGSKDSIPESPPQKTKKNKKSEKSDTDKFLAALSELNEPNSQPLENFFLSLAQRANSWSRTKQTQLEMKTLELFHQIEFQDD